MKVDDLVLAHLEQDLRTCLQIYYKMVYWPQVSPLHLCLTSCHHHTLVSLSFV